MHLKQTHAMPANLRFIAGSYVTRVRGNPMIGWAIKALALLITVALSISSTAVAKPRGPGKAFNKVVDVDALSITISVGTDGNTHQKYSITDATKITLNGAPVNARDLRAGMVVHVDLSTDGKTAETITAKDPPAHPVRGRTG
jgi:hypothetical protein